MSDYPNPNIHRGEGVTGRGLLIAFGIIVAIIAILAIVGTSNPPAEGTAGEEVITPAPAPQAVPLPTE